MSVIFTVIVYLILLGLLYYCVTLLPLPAPFPVILQVLFVLLVIFVLLSALGIVDGGLPRLRH